MNTTATANAIPTRAKRSKFKQTWRRLKRSRTAMIGLVLLIVIAFLALGAPLFFDYYEDATKNNISERFITPGNDGYIFGTDELGRNVFARIIFAARLSLTIGIVSCVICGTIGILMGAAAGYFGKWADNIIMRIADILMAIPSILLAIVIVAAFGINLFNIIIAVGAASIPQFIRITRASVLTVVNTEYIEAAHALGASTLRIIFKHILPNCFAPILVQITLRVAALIAEAASLSFLGLGVPAPTPEWGAMLAAGRAYMRDFAYLVMFPGFAIMLTILSLNLLGDGLRDALDPKLKK